MEDLKAIAQVVATLGVPTVLLLLLIRGAYQAARWFADKVILPVVNKVLAYVDAMQDHVAELTAQTREMRDLQQQTVQAIQDSRCRWPGYASVPHERGHDS